MMELDDIDLQLLRIVQENSKLTNKELADRVNLSITPVYERLKRLERDGYISGYSAQINTEKLGYGLIVFCNVRLRYHNNENGRKFVEAIAHFDEVTECYNTSGEYDFMMKVYVRDMKHYQKFVLDKMGVLDCIGSLHSVFVIGETKKNSGIKIP